MTQDPARSDRTELLDRWGSRLFRTVLLDRLRGERRWSEDPLRIGITLTRDDPTAGYGDYHTAHELGDALSILGFEVSYWERYGNHWESIDASVDVVIAMLDSFPVHSSPENAILVAWVRNWTERWIERPGFDDYDIVLVSSTRSKAIVEARSHQTAQVMPLATNPARFRPNRESTPRWDLVFSGSSWQQPRAVAEALPAVANANSVRVFGGGWERDPGMAGLSEGPVPYEQLPEIYRSARLVIDDSTAPTRLYRSVNARVFDALGAGTLVVSNDSEGVHDLFDGEFPVWHDAESLRSVVDGLLADPATTAELASRYRSVVLERHTYAHRAAQIREALVDWCEASRVSIAAAVPQRVEAESWGDFHFARGLQRQFRARGYPTTIELMPDSDRAKGGRADLRLHLFGLSDLRLRPGQLNLLWVISHPERVSEDLAEPYDAVFVASRRVAERLQSSSTKPARVLMQATDPDRFFPDRSGPRHQLLFVGNSRKVRRQIVDDVTALGHEPAIYGRDWTPDLVDPGFVRGELIENRELRRWYSSADVVLNDHWPEMRTEGFISNRIYDALACSACVVSDHVDGLDQEFDGAVTTYETRDELASRLEELLRDPELRKAKGAIGRAAVLARHTFAQRTTELLAVVEPLLAQRPSVIETSSTSATGGAVA